MVKSKLLGILLLFCLSISIFAQDDIVRKELDVPKVDPTFITLDGQMDEAEWQNAAEINIVTATSYEMFANKYLRDDLAEPEYDELFAKLLYSNDTLFAFIRIDEYVNDTTNLYWDGKWISDQLFVSLSSRLALNMKGWYDGNSEAAPEGPYHYWILGDQVTLNGGDTTWIGDEYMTCDSTFFVVPDASEHAQWATYINAETGEWNIEMRIHNPHVAANSAIGFNLGGSMGSTDAAETHGDAYGYWTWQPNIPDDPFGDPYGNGDPGFYNLADSKHWAILNFVPSDEDIAREMVVVPGLDSTDVVLDGVMDEPIWDEAATLNIVTSTEFNIFANKYEREDIAEPEYDELTAKLFYTDGMLYAFIHIDEFVNDTTDLYWDGKWISDQLFLSLSSRLAWNMKGWYDGNSEAPPEGPYHFWILGDQVTLNGGDTTWIGDEYLKNFCPDTWFTLADANEFAQWGTSIDKETGEWNVEIAIRNPNISKQSKIGFNLGGSMGSTHAAENIGDAYGYWTWQPNITDDPFGDPFGNGDPGFYNLANSEYWAVLQFGDKIITDVDEHLVSNLNPTNYSLGQNYPNPFNPATVINFAIPNNEPVSLKIFNPIGQLVTTLVNNKSYTPGNYSVNWNASGLSSGVYFYSLETSNSIITKKMMLIK